MNTHTFCKNTATSKHRWEGWQHYPAVITVHFHQHKTTKKLTTSSPLNCFYLNICLQTNTYRDTQAQEVWSSSEDPSSVPQQNAALLGLRPTHPRARCESGPRRIPALSSYQADPPSSKFYLGSHGPRSPAALCHPGTGEVQGGHNAQRDRGEQERDPPAFVSLLTASPSPAPPQGAGCSGRQRRRGAHRGGGRAQRPAGRAARPPGEPSGRGPVRQLRREGRAAAPRERRGGGLGPGPRPGGWVPAPGRGPQPSRRGPGAGGTGRPAPPTPREKPSAAPAPLACSPRNPPAPRGERPSRPGAAAPGRERAAGPPRDGRRPRAGPSRLPEPQAERGRAAGGAGPRRGLERGALPGPEAAAAPRPSAGLLTLHAADGRVRRRPARARPAPAARAGAAAGAGSRHCVRQRRSGAEAAMQQGPSQAGHLEPRRRIAGAGASPSAVRPRAEAPA